MSKKSMTIRGEIRKYAKGVGTVLLKLGQSHLDKGTEFLWQIAHFL